MAPVEGDSIGTTGANNDSISVIPRDVIHSKLDEKLYSVNRSLDDQSMNEKTNSTGENVSTVENPAHEDQSVNGESNATVKEDVSTVEHTAMVTELMTSSTSDAVDSTNENFNTMKEANQSTLASAASNCISKVKYSTFDYRDAMQSTKFLSLSSDDHLANVPKEVVDLEQKFAAQTEKELNISSNIEPLNLKERQKRYKLLMSLLGKSKEYANYMSGKLTFNTQCVDNSKSDSSQNMIDCAGSKRKKKDISPGNDGSLVLKKARLESKKPMVHCTNTHYKNAMGLIVSHRQPKLLTGGIMRDYQLDGLEWMDTLYRNGVNGILADEMGLGKTIQVIALLCQLREKHIYGPHLVIAPLSTLPNWIFEFANFAPKIPVALYHGYEEKRDKVMQQFVSAMAKKNRPALPVIVTSYEMPLRFKKFLSAVKWCSIIVDEGHRLKNYKSLLTQALKQYNAEYRLLLTGTPLQNNIGELWSLLNYLIPEIFDDLAQFENLFDFSDLKTSHDEFIQREKEEQLISKMHQILEPFLLRRVKADVNILLPEKKEILVKAPLTDEQAELYRKVLDRSICGYKLETEEADLDMLGKRKKRLTSMDKKYSEDWDIDEETDYIPVKSTLVSSKEKKRITSQNEAVEYVFNIKLTMPFMMMRKIVNHPYLVKTPVIPGTRDIIIDENLVQQSGKLLVLDALLPRLKVSGHKVLLFSSFKIMLDLVEDYMFLREYKYLRLDGGTSIEQRLEYIKQFNTDPDTFIFLITTRAGGLGINLTAADTVIIYDSDWNPQVDLQAQDRCHRIGQTRPVVVYRLITAGTIDEHIINTAAYKRRLEKLVVKKGKFKQKDSKNELSLAELKEVLESNDYKQVIHPNGLVLSDEEINRLLDRTDLLREMKVGHKNSI